MSKQLYDEAIADIKKIRELAENDAKLAIVEAVTPRIRELIEKELLAEAADDDRCDVDDEEKDCEVLNDEVVEGTDECAGEMSNEATEDPMRVDLDVAREAACVDECVGKLRRASSTLRSTNAFSEEISRLLSRVENMYESVQGTQPKDAAVLEQRLECLYKALNELQETTEMAKSRKQLNEEDVMVKLTGLPDGVDLENIGVDLIAGDEEVDDAAADAGDEVDATTGGEDEDFDLSSLGGDDDAPVDDGDEDLETESMDLSDDTVVEIDEGMLRREIKKLRALRESASCDDFGGGSSEGDPWLDATVDQEDGEGTVTVAENYDDDDTVDVDLSEFEDDDSVDVDLSDLDDEGGFDPDFGDTVDFEGKFELDPKQFEVVERKLELETRLLARAKARSVALREQIKECKQPVQVRKLRTALAEQSKRVVESTRRVEKIKELRSALVGKPRGAAVNEARPNRASRPAAERAGDEKLREQLAETNLQNAKLRCANKLLQNEGLSAREKVQVLERLNEAKTVREATLLYNGIVKTLTARSAPPTNDRRVLGSGSRPTGSGSPRPEALTEARGGTEIGDLDRWAKIAGLIK